MSDPQKHSDNPGETPELLERPEVLDAEDSEEKIEETIDHPAKVMRIGTMMKQLLDEVRATDLDEPSRDRLRDIYETSIAELGVALSADLREELGRLALPFGSDDTPSGAELQIAKAQLVGWLEGLVQGMQAMLFAQQMAAQQQLQSMRGQIGPPQSDHSSTSDERPGTYL
ncbi:MAG: DUF2587 domain-containing protein [Acidimicrobiaceae bacterium]|nr:DUF2587 domain-containing protein [Acidimicrobiaceae bacterium]MXW61548.1 DUF2587 domain-containing protein [Acidimicrobiaceae bacterium]MXW75532.1 DUF2587 domain-containing protein [Acidimicrobiaceae bacterium]MYA73188.1 DUF2587 domain-containing protein [Acidimicrobiaceae bacterium]MYC42192.1 DUF2587 domain-containing protein [Acidimicrobiaceae bacterium]